MKGKQLFVTGLAMALALALMAGLALAREPEAAPVGTAFTYQGQLRSNGTPYTGSCDFQFDLYDALSGGNQLATQPKTNVSVSQGYFTVLLEYGMGVFQGDARWLDIQVRCPSGGGSYTPLSPRQPLTPSPYALALPGLWTQQNVTSPNLIGGYVGNWVIDGANTATIGGGGQVTRANRVTDSGGTVGGGVNNQAGNGTGTTNDGGWATVGGGESNSANAYSTVGGGGDNSAGGGFATVGGGGSNISGSNYAVVGGGYSNEAGVGGGGVYAVVGGGYSNLAGNNSATVAGGNDNEATGQYATVGGGYSNVATYNSATVAGGNDNEASQEHATVGGGASNRAGSFSATVAGGSGNAADGNMSAIGGGYHNVASQHSTTVGGGWENIAAGEFSTVGGGSANSAGSGATVGGGNSNDASGYYATIGGGHDNEASGEYATVPGGYMNQALGNYSFAAGHNALANNQGCFVWSDYSTDYQLGCWYNNLWLARAAGGVYFYTSPEQATGAYLGPGGSSWNYISDRAIKENFSPVDGQAILETLASLPVQDYNLITQDPSIRHIGLVAQDFAAFGYGESDTAINAEDADGVAMAAIQALVQQVQTLQAENAALAARLAALEARVAREGVAP